MNKELPRIFTFSFQAYNQRGVGYSNIYAGLSYTVDTDQRPVSGIQTYQEYYYETFIIIYILGIKW